MKFNREHLEELTLQKIKEVNENNKINTKKYVNIIKGAGMLDWLLKNDSLNNSKIIEIDFNNVLNELKPSMKNESYESLISLIERRKSGQYIDEEPIKCVDEWIKNMTKVKFEQYNGNSEFSEGYDLLYHNIIGAKNLFKM